MITKFTSSYHCFSFMVFSCFPLSLLRPMHNTTQLIYINYYNLTTRTNTFVLNPLHPNNSVHRLHTLLYIEPINWYFTLLAGRVHLSVNWKLLKLANIFFYYSHDLNERFSDITKRRKHISGITKRRMHMLVILSV